MSRRRMYWFERGYADYWGRLRGFSRALWRGCGCIWTWFWDGPGADVMEVVLRILVVVSGITFGVLYVHYEKSHGRGLSLGAVFAFALIALYVSLVMWGWKTPVHVAARASSAASASGAIGLLVGLALGAKLLELPLLIRSIMVNEELRPELEDIQRFYHGDAAGLQGAMNRFYAENAGRLLPGCAVVFLDWVFVIWALVSLSDFSPQMRLDGAEFLWIPSVVEFNLPIVICWLVLNAILTLVNASIYAAQARQVGCTTIFFGIIIAGIAAHWHWPAYVFVFWLLLSVMGFVMSRALTAIVRQFQD